MTIPTLGRLVVAMLAISGTLTAVAESVPRPSVGLVLSGGGARGAAHVGVLKVLESQRIAVDYIAGTSMGAIVGGLYASGMTAAELETVVVESDWPALLRDRPPRARRSYRRKSDDVGFLVNFDMGVGRDGLSVPAGLIQGQNLTLALRRFVTPVATVRDFDLLPIPFRAVATDIETGEGVVLGHGDLALAMRASMSAPGVFTPVRIDGRPLVDGGLANNLPVDVARAMGADVLIVVDVGFPLLKEEELASAIQITTQMLTILINSRAREQIDTMREADVLIAPMLGTFGSDNFDQVVDAMNVGETAAYEQLSALAHLSLSAESYSAYRQSLSARRSGLPLIHQVRIENESRLSERVIAQRVRDQSGGTLDLDKLETDLADVYGFDTFETVDYNLEQTDIGTGLLIRGREKSWGPNFIRFGINLEDDFKGSSNYNVGARLTMTELNRLGGELRVSAQIGETPNLLVDFFQPVDYGSRWFVNPAFTLERSSSTVFDGRDKIARLQSNEVALGLSAGRQFGNWGALRATVTRAYGDVEVSIGDPRVGSAVTNLGGIGLEFGVDTIDRLAIPRSGTALAAEWFSARRSLGSDSEFDAAAAFLLKPQTFGRNTFLHWWNLGTVYDTDVAGQSPLSLGGLFSLSGYAARELDGRHAAIGRLIYYRRLSDGSGGALGATLYAGASVEVGNAWQDSDDISVSNVLAAGSLFVVVDTLLGPIYLAYGAAEGGRESFYLFLGQTF